MHALRPCRGRRPPCCLQALNAVRMSELLAEAEGLRGDRLVIPQPIMELTTR